MNDNQQYNPYENHNPTTPPPTGPYRQIRPVNMFETLSFGLGFSSLLCCTCLWLSLPMGAMAILFALLSRGGKMELSSKAKLGLALGVIGLVITILFYAMAFVVALREFGSFEGILREACDMYGYDFEELFGDMFQ